MRKVKEILRLKYHCGQSERSIATACNISRSSVADYLRRASECGLSWPLPPELDEAELNAMLFPVRKTPSETVRPVPDWKEVHKEMRRKGVTLMLLWEEHISCYPEGYSYSRYCELYGIWKRPLNVTMRQVHVAGDKLFVDWSGMTVPVIDPSTGEERQAEIFVAVLGASNYTYLEASWSQTLPDWIGAHVRAFDFMGSVPRCLVPDYVPRHIIGLMWPSSICGRQTLSSVKTGRFSREWEHNDQRVWSHWSKSESSCHTGFRRYTSETPKAGSQVRIASTFMRRVISA